MYRYAGRGRSVRIWCTACPQSLPRAGISALSLGELYLSAGRDQDVITLTNGLTNEDDATALLLAYRGEAFARQDLLTEHEER